MRLTRWVVLWLALIVCGGALAHVTTTGLLRIEFTGGRMLYALSVALPELPAASAAILTAAANGDRAAAETVAEAARRSVTVDLDGERCRAGRVRIGGAGTNETRATVEIDFTCDASHGRLDVTEDWRAFLGEHYQTLGNLRTPSGERPGDLRRGNRGPSLSTSTAPSRRVGSTSSSSASSTFSPAMTIFCSSWPCSPPPAARGRWCASSPPSHWPTV